MYYESGRRGAPVWKKKRSDKLTKLNDKDVQKDAYTYQFNLIGNHIVNSTDVINLQRNKERHFANDNRMALKHQQLTRSPRQHLHCRLRHFSLSFDTFSFF